MKKIFLIIGIFGHLGSTIARLFHNMGLKIRGLALPNDDASVLSDIMNLEIIRGDITKKETLDPLFQHAVDEELYVIHAAGIISIYGKYSELMNTVNVIGTKNICDKCLEYGVKRLLYVSSVHAIEPSPKKITMETNDFDPQKVVGAYAKTKAAATAYVLSQDQLDVVVIHPSGIMGPGDNGHNHLNALVKAIMNQKLRIGVKGGYDIVDVRDVAKACYLALLNGRNKACYLITNEYISIQELFNTLTDMTGQKRVKVFLPLWFAKIFAKACEYFYKLRKKTPLFTSYSLHTLGEHSIFSHELASMELGYEPRSIETTIHDTLEWLKAN